MNFKQIATTTLIVLGSISLTYNAFTLIGNRELTPQEKTAYLQGYKAQKTEAQKTAYLMEYLRAKQRGFSLGFTRSSAGDYDPSQNNDKCRHWLEYMGTYMMRAAGIGSSEGDLELANAYLEAADEMGERYWSCMGWND